MGRPAAFLAGADLQYVPIVAGALVDNAPENRRVIVLGYVINGTGVVKFTDGETDWEFDLAEKGGVSYPGGASCPAFECAKGADLDFEGEATGHLTYVIV